MPYVIYIGGERLDRPTTEEDKRNVQRVLSIMDKKRCYTTLYEAGRKIGQAEHVLDNLVDISYIPCLSDVEAIKRRLRGVGVTALSVATCDDEDCLHEVSSEDIQYHYRRRRRV